MYVCEYYFIIHLSLLRYQCDGVCVYSRVVKSENKSSLFRFWCGSKILTVYAQSKRMLSCRSFVERRIDDVSVCNFNNHIHNIHWNTTISNVRIMLEHFHEISFDNCLYSFVSCVLFCLGGCAPCSMCCFMNNYTIEGEKSKREEEKRKKKYRFSSFFFSHSFFRFYFVDFFFSADEIDFFQFFFSIGLLFTKLIFYFSPSKNKWEQKIYTNEKLTLNKSH